ncbi:hypothetical protein IHE55_20420 [Streptomyces pactum]|uniref:Uncharacterized protein n=1 Tax=Streptomyces pactum TaxID=68249 RepID=A0ABS0NP71_9ACTN|nr:hypothetical protein [Streptomyces pactum]MBH5336999.1 hypothetical protein [Streptomyces pactum]
MVFPSVVAPIPICEDAIAVSAAKAFQNFDITASASRGLFEKGIITARIAVSEIFLTCSVWYGMTTYPGAVVRQSGAALAA